MTVPVQPHREALRTTLLRTIFIALVAGAAVAHWSGGRLSWPLAALLVLWFSFGGHWVELWYLRWLRPRLSAAHAVRIATRIGTWFVGGTVLALGMVLTARALSGNSSARWPAWWMGGAAFIGLELLVHLALQVRGRPSVFNGRG
jgi:hypothetical protein